MKNRFVYLFLCLFSFLIFYSNVDAKEVVVNVSKGETKLFISSLDYDGVTCENIDNLKNFKVINNEGDYTVSIKDNVSIDEVYSEVLTCNYIKSNKEDSLSNDNSLKYILSISKNSYYEYKDLLVNEIYLFKKDNVKFDSCYSLSDDVLTNISNGICEVKVLKKNSTVMEVIGLVNNVPYVLKINVVESKESNKEDVRYESISTEWHTNELSYINYNDYLIAGDKYDKNTEDKDNEGNSDYEMEYGNAEADVNVSFSKSTACNSYIVSELGSYKYFGQYSYNGQFNGLLGMTTFKAVEQCSGNSESYAAICLDPGMAAPNGINYKVSRVINPTVASVNQEFDKAAYYIASQIKGEGDNLKKYDNPSIIAAQIALRLISLTSGNAPSYYSDGNPYIFYMQYKYIADELKAAKKSNKTKFQLNTWTWCQLDKEGCWKFDKDLNKVSYTPNVSASVDQQIKEKAESFLSAYLTNYSGFSFPTSEEYNFSMGDVEFQTQAIDDYNKKATFKGVLNVPEGINLKTDAKYRLYCHSDLKCEFKLLQSGEYTLTVTYNKNQEALLKKSSNLRVRLRFTNDKMNFNVSLLEPYDGSTSLQRILIFNTDDTIIWLKFSSDVAEKLCDLTGFPSDPTMMTDNQKDYFTSNECCDFVKPGTPYYEALCTCTTNNYELVCDPENKNYTDLYEIQEGRTSGAPRYSTCVVDVAWKEKMDESYNETDKKLDAAGNKLSLKDYYGNKYCRVSCFEDWQFVMSSFKNFTGENAVKAGSYFQIDNDIFIGAKRTCVTTLVDYKMYYDDVKTLANKIVVAWNSYMEFASAYDNMKKNFGHTTSGSSCKGNSTENPIEKTYIKTYEVSTITVSAEEAKEGGCCGLTCGSCKVDTDGDGVVDKTSCCTLNDCPAHTHYVYEPVEATCNIYNIHTHKGESLSANFTDLDYQDTNGNSDSKKLNYTTASSSCQNATHGVVCSRSGSSSVTEGVCESDNFSSPFDDMVKKVSYTSLNTAHLSTPGHERTDGRDKEGELDLTSDNVVDMHTTTKKLLKQYLEELKKLVSNMNDCQNFYLSNTLSDETKYNYGKTIPSKSYEKGYGYETTNNSIIPHYKVSPKEIKTIYDPEARYQYEEAEYMTLIGSNNYLVNNIEKNNLYNSGNNACGTAIVDGKTLNVCKNKITTYSYTDKWNNDTSQSRNYSDGTEKSTGTSNITKEVLEENKKIDICRIEPYGDGLGWSSGTNKRYTTCLDATLYYYKAYYRKQTLENSSFYKNWGNWYVNDKTDVKIHAHSLNDSGDKESVKNLVTKFSKADWSPIAAYNVFPIKITTRANIYRYMYTFGNIGHYSDNSLGRIMGKETSIILDNRHVCFYEVYEEICKCCGDPIVTEHIENNDPTKSDYGVITDEYLKGYCSSHECHDSDDGYVGNTPVYSTSGTLGFYSSSVSLYDLDAISGTDAYLSKNWSNNDTFYYNGDNYQTSKGGQLATYIQSVGEDIYNKNPEYSYYLTPAALNEIRNTGVTQLASEGKFRIKGISNSTKGENFDINGITKDEEKIVVTFDHYKSGFLRDLMSKYITEQYKNVVISGYRMDSSCVVTASDMKNDNPFAKGENCKWYDYVQCNGGECFRLAYK